MPTTLREHRQAIAEASNAYLADVQGENIHRLCRTLVPHVRKAGLRGVTVKRSHKQLERLILLLFEAQDQRPMFHVEGTELPLCWNAPIDWNKAYIKYEWGHLLSRNQAGAQADNIENLALYSARCNQHIQTSLNIYELMIYGGVIAQRISQVLTNRRRLFESTKWQEALCQLRNSSPV